MQQLTTVIISADILSTLQNNTVHRLEHLKDQSLTIHLILMAERNITFTQFNL